MIDLRGYQVENIRDIELARPTFPCKHQRNSKWSST